MMAGVIFLIRGMENMENTILTGNIYAYPERKISNTFKL